jgi:hypothetical protein
MTDAVTPTTDPVQQITAYIAKRRAALDSRDPFEVLREMPSALRPAIDGPSPESLGMSEGPDQ